MARKSTAATKAAAPTPTPAIKGHFLIVGCDEITPCPTNPRKRFDPTAQAELETSILAHGVLQPPLVRPSPTGKGYELIVGERRWRAAVKVGLTKLRVLVHDLDDKAETKGKADVLAKKHSRPRDLPSSTTRTRPLGDAGGVHAHRRIRKEDGTSFPVQSLSHGVPPKRPPISMLFEDLAGADVATGVFGMYPANLIPKLLPWLRCDRREVLHVCSGGLQRGEGIRVDLRPAARPDIVADGRALPFASGSIAGVMLDPPYTEHYARELYAVEYPRPAHLLAEAARVVRPGGRIVFVHYLVPNAPPCAAFIKAFGLSMGFGYPMRAVTIYERNQEALPGLDPPSHGNGMSPAPTETERDAGGR